MNKISMAALVLAVVGVSGCGVIFKTLGGPGTSNRSRSGRDTSQQATEARSKFLSLPAPDSKASFLAWIKAYERARGLCVKNGCGKEVDGHYLAVAPKNVEMFIARGEGLLAHYAARRIGYHSRHRHWNLKSQAPVDLARKAAAARAAEAQKLFTSIQRYAEVNTIGCVASSKTLPAGNQKISDLVFHARIGQRLFVRCFMPTRISSMMSGKPRAALRGEVNTTDQNLQNCGGYTCTKDPDMSYAYKLEIDVARFGNKDYFDFVFNTSKSPRGKTVTKDDFGAIEVTGSLYWVSAIKERWNKKIQAVERVPIYDQAKGVTTLSYEI